MACPYRPGPIVGELCLGVRGASVEFADVVQQLLLHCTQLHRIVSRVLQLPALRLRRLASSVRVGDLVLQL